MTKQAPRNKIITIAQPAFDVSAAKVGTQAGSGWAIAHHGELLQGAFESLDGRLHRGLVTLPMPILQAHATFQPHARPGMQVEPCDRSKAARAAAIVLARLGNTGGGKLILESRISVGHGYGSSTADVVATIRAVADANAVTLTRQTIAELAVRAESASDAIVYEDQALLFAHREGRVLEHFGGPLPPLLVVGLRKAGAEGVDTLRFARAHYGSDEIETFHVLRGLMQRAVEQQDPWLAGRVATASANINQRFLPKPHLSAIQQIADHYHACGIQVAHSGTAIGVLLDPSSSRAGTRARQIAKAAAGVGLEADQIFLVNCEAARL
jgi:uncharacterized protein involved in propanediol utilization